MNKILVILIIACFAVSSFADVSVNINVTAEGLTDESDAAIATADGFFLLIADVDGDGLDGWTVGGSGNIGSIDFTSGLTTGDDIVLYQGGFAFDSAGLSPNEQLTYTGVSGGEAYYLVWSNIGSSAADFGENNIFGVFREDNVNWEVPATGGVYPVVYDANADGASYYQTVPEPASALLALIGGGVAFIVRRRGNKFVA